MAERTCFVIAPIGEPGSRVRKRSDVLMKHVIERAVRPLGYTVVRADRISTPGMLALQIPAQLYNAALVIADLTDGNFNVGYELGIRHTLSKPAIQLIAAGRDIPFDVASMRTIIVDMSSPAKLNAAVVEIQSEIRAVTARFLTPVSALLDVEATVRDTEMFDAASATGHKIPPQRRAVRTPRAQSNHARMYVCEEDALFWESLHQLPFDRNVESVLMSTVLRIVQNPEQAPATHDGLRMIKTRPALMNGEVVPALRVAYVLKDDVVHLLHVVELDGDEILKNA